MPPIGAMAFTPEGDALWTVSHGSIEIRSWPELTLVASVPAASGGISASFSRRQARFARLPPLALIGLHAVAFHPAGRMAAVSFGGRIRFFGMDGTALPRTVDLSANQGDEPLLALAFDDQGRLLAATPGGVIAIAADGSTARIGAVATASLPRWIWKATLLPGTGQAIYCANDHPAAILGWRDGRVTRDDEWADGLFEGDPTSWLAADVAPGERALVCGRKSGRTWVVHLRAGIPARTVLLEKSTARRPEGKKRPSRTSAHAIHPTDDAVVYAEISGLVGHAKLSTGAFVRDLPSHSGGYAWE